MKLLKYIYLPVYLLGYVLWIIARLLLAVSYFALLIPNAAIDILKYTFTDYARRTRRG